MSTIEKTINVNVPIRTAYDQWTHFESFPHFMEGVEEVRQIDATHLHWKAHIAGVTREWDAEIIDQLPDRTVTWRSTDGTTNHGAVTFEPSETGTRVTLRLEFEPEGILERVGDALNVIEHRAASDLERFRAFIEGDRGVVDPHEHEEPIVGRGADGVRTEGIRPDGILGTPPL